MGQVIEITDPRRSKLNRDRVDELTLKLSGVIGNAELINTEDEDIMMDAISEVKCDEIENLIYLEYLKAGYSDECL